MTDTSTTTTSDTPTLAIAGTPASFYPVGVAMSFTPEVTGAQGATTFSISGPAMPAGMVLDATTGVISGTPTVVGGVATTLKVTDTASTKFLPLVLDVVARRSISGAPTDAVMGVPYTCSLATTGGSGTLTLKSVSAGVPTWLSVTVAADEVVLSGVPTESGSFPISITLSDDYGDNLSVITLVVEASLSVMYDSSVATITPGGAVTFKPTVTGGSGTVTFVTTSEVPTGITIDAQTGVVSGAVATVGDYTIGVKATSGSQTAASTLEINVVEAITLQYGTLNAVQGTQVSLSPTVTGGSGTRTFAISASSKYPIPNGLTLDPNTGVISGKPLVSADYTFSVSVTDGTGGATADVVTLIVTPISIGGSLTPVAVGSVFAFTPTVTGGDAEQYTFSYQTNPGLPYGVSFNSVTGALTGSSAVAVSQEVVISVTDGVQTAKLTVNLNIAEPATLVQNQTVTCAVGSSMSYKVQGSNLGSSPVFSVVLGTLPAGLEFQASTGTISGTPVQAGTTSVTVKVIGAVNSATTVITVTAVASLTLTGAPPQGTSGIAYNFKPVVSGGSGSYQFSLSAPNGLVAGLSFSASTGAITGTPTTSGTSTVSITATDGLTSATLSNLAIVIMAVSPSSDGDVNDLFVEQRCAAYVSVLTGARVTQANYEQGMRYMADITNAIIAKPTTTALDALYAIQYQYRATLFDELNFFIGCEVLTDMNMQRISALYRAYRAITMTPKIVTNFSYLTRSPISSATIASYMTSKRLSVAG